MAGGDRWRRRWHEAWVLGVPLLMALPFDDDLVVGAPTARTLGHIALAAAASALLLARRRAPLAVTAVLAGLASLLAVLDLPAAMPAALVAVAAAATRCSLRRTAVAAGLLVLAQALGVTFAGPVPRLPWSDSGALLAVALAGAAALVAAGTGLHVGARRQLLASAQERAERAEAERELLADRARSRERARIAREMHDVLAHRLSVLALHAGALEHRAQVRGEDEESTRALGVVRENAHLALEELRGVLGVLRAGDVPGAPDADLHPHPALDSVGDLVADAGALAPVHLRTGGDLDAVAPAVSRAAYRVVQEGLTNARKHAPGAAVDVGVDVGAGAVRVEVRNGPPGEVPGAHPVPAGSGTGLVGVAERAALLGGRVEHAPTGDGGYALRVLLPRTGAAGRDEREAGR